MTSLIIFLIVAIVVIIVLFIAIDYFAGAVGGDARLWMVLKGLILIGALVIFLQRAGVI